MIVNQRTFSGVPGDSKCECADAGCAVHVGVSDCRELATTILYRVDMQDETGTAFCEACADDAMESGVFTDLWDTQEEREAIEAEEREADRANRA
jgi:hypothetical protein